ncbi:MAG TPA: PASTA domain-containing protein, partial [Solirubrobacteraceae bacterium]|nr:PASTA domain-containing protein [Solirubrobacteraceae bacterium]
TVTGTAPGAGPGDRVDIVCYTGASSQFKTLVNSVAVSAGGTFSTLTGSAAPPLSAIATAGRPCRLRAVPHNGAGTGDRSVFAGPDLAISETALLPTISGGPNDGTAYNFYVNGMTFTASAAWKAPGTPATPTAGGCGGPYATTVDPAFDLGNEYPIDCAGSLFGDDLGTFGGRSEVVIDGRNAYDPAAAQGLIPRTSGQDNGSQDLPGFPKPINVAVDFDPTSGRISSRLVESFVSCHGTDPYKPLTTAVCPSFDDTGVALTRVITTSDGGQVMTLTDTWSSTDGKSHTLDLLYDDYAGVFGNADGERGWQFPGQSGFTQYAADASVPASGSAPASVLLRTNITAPDGDPNEGFGAITFGHAPAGFRFAGPSELEEDQLLTVPAGGTASLSYVYSIASTQAGISSLAVAALDRFQPAAVQITSPADGTTMSAGDVTLTGTATAGSGIKSLVVGGQAVSVAPGGTWSAQVPLSAGANTITALATDGAGATTQDQVTVVYQPPSPSSASSAPPTPVTTPVAAKCRVPRVKGMKLHAAEKALRKAHCRVGKVKHVNSHKLARGRVMSTKPRAGRRFRAGTRIELFVSKGR